MNKNILKTTFIALFAAIICIGTFIKIPIGPIPIVLQNALCVLTGVILGGIWGGAPSLVWMLAGLIGLPVYAGGTSGIGVWLGPTGGFLPGYVIGALVASLIAGKPSVSEKKDGKARVVRVALAMVAGMVILYIPGVIHFARWAVSAGKVPAEKSVMAYTMGACVLPYIPGDIIKILVSVPVALKVRPILAQYLYSGKKENSKNISEESKSLDSKSDEPESAKSKDSDSKNSNQKI